MNKKVKKEKVEKVKKEIKEKIKIIKTDINFQMTNWSVSEMEGTYLIYN